jgi:hypothetical protein
LGDREITYINIIDENDLKLGSSQHEILRVKLDLHYVYERKRIDTVFP